MQRQKNEFENSTRQPPFQVDEKWIQLMRFINLIEENYQKRLSVAEYAQKLFISKRTLALLTNQLI